MTFDILAIHIAFVDLDCYISMFPQTSMLYIYIDCDVIKKLFIYLHIYKCLLLFFFIISDYIFIYVLYKIKKIFLYI